jgi:NitT/TauT family transport system substrate-binding protein
MRKLLSAVAGIALFIGAGAQAQTKIEIGYIPVLGSSQAFVLEGEGWAKEAGLDVKLTKFDSGPAMIQALAAGKIDAYYGGVTPIIVAKANDAPISIIAAAATEEMVLVGRGKYADLAKTQGAGPALLAFEKSEGRKVKISSQPAGSVPDTITRYWLQEIAKVPVATVEILSMGIDKTQQALLSKAVELAPVREPTITILRDLDPSLEVVAKGGDLFPGQPGSVVSIRDDFKAKNPEAVATLLKLHIRATEALRKDAKAVSGSVHKVLGAGLSEPSVIERALTSPYSVFIADPNLILESTDKMQKFQHGQGAVSKLVALDKLFDLDLYKKVAGR